MARLFAWANLPDRPVVMGVLNVTPDSFSDGGDYGRTDVATRVGVAMIQHGADMLDIGGESTRPGAAPVTPDQEQSRVLPVIAALVGAGVPLSVDTRHASTMAAALQAGATIVNDVSGLSHDPAAAATIAAGQVGVILMHMRGTPATMNKLAHYTNIAAEVAEELCRAVDHALAAGIDPSQIALDPGIGFAKSGQQNIELLRNLPHLAALGFPLVVGVSRKRFIGHLTGMAVPKDRDAGSLAAALFALSQGARILRVHDVPGTVQAVRVWQALAGCATTTP